jgi:hypothetical protein
LESYVVETWNCPSVVPSYITLRVRTDPVSGQLIHLNPRQKTATVNSFPGAHRTDGTAGQMIAKGQPAIAKPLLQAHSKTRPEVEKLGQETIDGVYAEGERITTVIRSGTQGNDRDITVVTERWRSPDLGIEVLCWSWGVALPCKFIFLCSGSSPFFRTVGQVAAC